MGVTVLILLFFLGVLLATIGGIIGVVDAFRVNVVWGLLALFIPFALLVFCIKFWGQRKWARNSLIMSLLGLLAMVVTVPLGGLRLLAGGSTPQQESDDLTLEADPTAAGDATDPAVGPEDGATDVSEGEEDGDLFKEAMLPGLPTAAEIARAELLPSTDPNERFNEIDRERSDPYAFVPIAPPPRPAPPAPENGGGNNGNGNNPNQAGGGTSPQGTPNNQGAGAQPDGGNAQPSPNAPLPDLPEPTVIASQVQVTGVASVDGKSYAIVKAPNEPTSRYVEVGQRIANGSVLVKRIENRSGIAPIVILEERGQEIALPVGANVGAPEEPAAEPPTAPEDLAIVPALPPVR
ncbi:MAG: hypothetical protein AAF892_17370 [Cyanobacteria bacterium P01_D01_bin.71]